MKEHLDAIKKMISEFGEGADFVCFAIANESKGRGITVLKGCYYAEE